MTTRKICVPDIGDFTDVPVIEIAVAAGDHVAEGDTLIVLESDKATIDVPSEVAGKIVEVIVSVDDLISEGSAILSMESDALTAATVGSSTQADASISAAADQSSDAIDEGANEPPARPVESSVQSNVKDTKSHNVADSPVADQSSVTAVNNAVYASPSVRRMARELGADIHKVTGFGPKHRITRDDVTAFVKSCMTASGDSGVALKLSSTLAAIPAWPKVDFAQFGAVSRVPLSRINKISGPALARNAIVIPHVTNFEKADVTDIETFRETLNVEAGPDDAKITLLAFAVKAVVSALQQYPKFNASLDGEELVLKQYWNIGVAADTADGLLVPVLKDADKKGVRDIANEMSRLATDARNGALKPSDMQGATFTISSLGGIGGTNFTPIINAPEVAILGLPRSEIQPVWDGVAFQPRRIQPLSLSFDHRVIDGVAAANFLVQVAAILNDFRRTAV